MEISEVESDSWCGEDKRSERKENEVPEGLVTFLDLRVSGELGENVPIGCAFGKMFCAKC